METTSDRAGPFPRARCRISTHHSSNHTHAMCTRTHACTHTHTLIPTPYTFHTIHICTCTHSQKSHSEASPEIMKPSLPPSQGPLSTKPCLQLVTRPQCLPPRRAQYPAPHPCTWCHGKTWALESARNPFDPGSRIQAAHNLFKPHFSPPLSYLQNEMG